MPSFIQRTMHYRKEHSAWQAKYDARAPKAGDPAPCLLYTSDAADDN